MKPRVLERFDKDILLYHEGMDSVVRLQEEKGKCSITIKFTYNSKPLLITDRDFDEYSFSKEIVIKSDFQYLEVGPGLSAFIPRIAEYKLKKKPIIIEPIDYSLLKELLIEISSLELKTSFKERIETLIKRCEFFSDPDKVYHIKKTLGEALVENEELKGIADVVVDHFGATAYAYFTDEEILNTEKVIELEHVLLKESGELFHTNIIDPVYLEPRNRFFITSRGFL